MKRTIFLLINCACYCTGMAQSSMDTVLRQIEANNPTIRLALQSKETRHLQSRTGLNPSDPVVTYDYMAGSPSAAGSQRDFTVVQSFDFPTAYHKKKAIAGLQDEKAQQEMNSVRRNVLLEARKVCIELIYRNRLGANLDRLKGTTEKLLADFSRKLEVGEGNVLDVNKARLQLVETDKEYRQNLTEQNRLQQALASLNGGKVIVLRDTVYPLMAEILPFGQLLSSWQQTDPRQRSLEQEIVLAERQVELNRALSLPKLEVGYHYQGLLGQTFQGARVGISLPLWENRNRVKAQRSRAVEADLGLWDYTNKLYHELKARYEQYENLKATVDEYRTVLEGTMHLEKLNRALQMGEITVIEYFIESNYYQQALRNSLKTEMEYYSAIAELNSHLL